MWMVSPPTVRPPYQPKFVPPAKTQCDTPLQPTAISSCSIRSSEAAVLPLCALSPQLSNQPLHNSETISGLSGQTDRVACQLGGHAAPAVAKFGIAVESAHAGVEGHGESRIMLHLSECGLMRVVAVDPAGPMLIFDLAQNDRAAAIDLPLDEDRQQPIEPALHRGEEDRIIGAEF